MTKPTQDTMRRVHLVAGIVTVLGFLLSGAYMMFVARADHLAPGPRLMYTSRHIYLLAPALVHLVLAVYVRLASHPRVPRLQWTGTVLLTLSSAFLMLAFFVEPMAGRDKSVVSALGIFMLWAGAILHVIAPRFGRTARS